LLIDIDVNEIDVYISTKFMIYNENLIWVISQNVIVHRHDRLPPNYILPYQPVYN